MSSHYWKIHFEKNVSTIWKWTRAKVTRQKETCIRFLSCRYLMSWQIKSCHVIAATLDLIESEIAPFDPSTRKTVRGPTVEQNMMWIGWPFAEIWPFEIRHIMRGTFGTQYVWGRGGRTGSSMVSFKRAMVVSYRLSIVTIALFLTIRQQFAIECLRR